MTEQGGSFSPPSIAQADQIGLGKFDGVHSVDPDQVRSKLDFPYFLLVLGLQVWLGMCLATVDVEVAICDRHME
jgi:hypothetical protein